MNKPKRLRRPTLKNGELRVYWGRVDGDYPDIVYEWKGDRSMKRDSALLNWHMGCKHPHPTKSPFGQVMEPSMLEELERRGYDLTTLQFRIMKKGADNG